MKNFSRRPPITSPDGSVTLHDFRVGDRVRVPISGRTGVIVSRRRPSRDGWNVRWDEPVYGVTEGRVSTSNMEPES